MPPDPRPDPRVRDPQLLRSLHGKWRECALCGATDHLSLHHIRKRPRDDVEANLVMVCGDGVRGCHGALESHHGPTERRLMNHLLDARPDTIFYLRQTMGQVAAENWIERQLS